MSWKPLTRNNRADYGKRYATDALEVPDVGSIVQTTVERVGPAGTAISISSVFVPGVKPVEVVPGKFELLMMWSVEASTPVTGSGCDEGVTSVELTGDVPQPTENVATVEPVAEPIAEPIAELVAEAPLSPIDVPSASKKKTKG